jgi:hypothetical protein
MIIPSVLMSSFRRFSAAAHSRTCHSRRESKRACSTVLLHYVCSLGRFWPRRLARKIILFGAVISEGKGTSENFHLAEIAEGVEIKGVQFFSQDALQFSQVK